MEERLEKLEKAIDILMEKGGYFWCNWCSDWINETDIDRQSHFHSKHL